MGYVGWTDTIAESLFEDNRSRRSRGVFKRFYRPDKSPEEAAKKTAISDCCPILDHMRALIAENSRLYRQLLDNILGQQGFSNDICDNLADARDYIESEDYDLICVNQQLQDGSGLDLVEFCNQHAKHKNTPLLLLSADKSLTRDDLSVRVDEVVHKNNLQQIADQITHFVELHLDPVFFEGRILFVEDDEEIAAATLEALQQTGYRVSHFTTAEEAWQVFEKEVAYGSDTDAYDLVITDVNLEGSMSGQELISLVRQLEDARGFVPIIAITEENSASLRIALYQVGANDFLHKPILSEELLVRISNLITNKRLLDKVHDIRRELFALATTDKLTGCHNRHSLMEFSDKFISHARRHDFPISVMVIDLDHFKSINDNHGHAVGDLVLQAVGRLLNESFREGDLVARFGGEEFVVLLNHCDSAFAADKAGSLRAEIEALRPNDLTVTASIGVTTLEPGNEGDFEALFSAADRGVYQAKEEGRNRVVFLPLD